MARRPTPRADHHPGNITQGDQGFRQDEPPAFSQRDVFTSREPVLYDHRERPIYRRIGFTVTRG